MTTMVNTVDGPMRAHPLEKCRTSAPCPIHAPSRHHMRDWPLKWRGDRRILERVCPHGIGHPDPDDAAFRALKGRGDTTHSCDGCCGMEVPF